LKLTYRNIIHNVIALLSGTTISQILKMITILLIARQLGVRLYGLYASSLAMLTASSILFNLGLDTWLLREGGRKEEILGPLFGAVLTIKSILGLGWFVVTAILFAQLNWATFPLKLVCLTAIAVWLDSILLTSSTAFRASLKNYMASVPTVINAVSLLLVTFMLIIQNNVNVVWYMLVRVIVASLSATLALILVWRANRFNVQYSLIQQALKESPAFAWSDFLAWMGTRLDVVITAFMLGEYEVGLYSPAVGIVSALFFVPAAAYNVLVPVLSNLFAKNLPQAYSMAKRTILILSAIGLSLNIMLAMGSPLLVKLLGTSYAPTQNLLPILSLILTFKGVSFGMAAILVAVGWQKQRTVVQAVAVLMNFSLNLIAIRSFGITGAAIIYVITESVLMLGYSWQTWQYYISVQNKIGESTL